MDANFNTFIAETKEWLFNLEAELSLGKSSSMSLSELPSYLKRLASLFLEADDKYNYNLNDILVDFPRVSEEYKTYSYV